MGKLIESSYYDTDVSANNSSIDYSKLAISEKPMASVYADVTNYLLELGIDNHVKTKRKFVKYIDPIIANKLMFFLFEKYKDDACVTRVDIFSAVLDVIDVDHEEFYELLTDKIKSMLKESLQENFGFKINFDIDKKALKKLGVKQIEI